MKPVATKMTYDQFCLLPEDRKRHELMDGELFVTPAPNPKHQEIVGELYSLLSAFVKANALGKVYIAPVDVVFDEHTTLEPDILFIRQARRGIVGEDAIHGAPELVVEVLSPSTFYHDLRRKMAVYAQFGVQEYWIIDPEKQTIELYGRVGEGLELARRSSSDETFESPLLPGFQLLVNSIF